MNDIHFLATGAEQVFGVVTAQDGDTLCGAMPTARVFPGEDGRLAVGSLGILVDDILGYSIIGSLHPGAWTVSTEIWIDMIAPLPGDGDLLSGSARIVAPGSFAVGQVVDASGQLVAECRQRGREVLDPPDFAVARTEFEFDPLDIDTDLSTVLGLEEHAEELVLPTVPRWENPRGTLHGGVSLAATEAAATRSRMLAGSKLATSSLHIVHTRAVPSGVQVELRTTTRHAGRTLWVTDVDAVVDGKVCATTRVSAQA